MPKLKPAVWIFLGIVAIAAIFGIFRSIPLDILFNDEELEQYLQASGQWSAVPYLVIFIGATVLGFPGNILTVAGGAVYGLVWGAILSQIGATVGAVGAFCLARYGLHDWIQTHYGQHRLLRRLNREIAHNPLSVLLVSRFSPLSPFSLVNFLFGLTPIDLKTYTIGTFLGIIPLTLAYTWLGVTGKALLSGGDRLPLMLALGFLTFLSMLPMLSRWIKR